MTQEHVIQLENCWFEKEGVGNFKDLGVKDAVS